MKKMLFSLIATVMLCVSGNAQTNEEILKVYQENRPVFAKLMSDFTTQLKPFYSKGMTYDTFTTKIVAKKELSTDGDIILKKVFSYIQTGTSSEIIKRNETGYEIAIAYLNYSKATNKTSFENYLFGESNSQAKGFWSSLWQGIKDAVAWIWDHAEEIITTYIKCCKAKLCCN